MAGFGAEAFVLHPGDGREIDLGGFRMSVKATSDQTNGAFTLLEAQEPAGFGPPLHIHRDAAEAFYVVEGEYIIYIDGREASCPAGSFIFIPAGIRARVPSGWRAQPKAEPLHAGGDGRLFRRGGGDNEGR